MAEYGEELRRKDATADGDLNTRLGIGSLAAFKDIAKRRKELTKLPGFEPTDYSKHLSQAQQTGKLQLALALAQQGFEAAGTVPREGEWALTTLGRGLAPIAPIVGKAASDLQKQRRALKFAEKEEQRALTTAALTQEQGRLDALAKANLSMELERIKRKDAKPTMSIKDDVVAFVRSEDGKKILRVPFANVGVLKFKDGRTQLNLVGKGRTETGAVLAPGTPVEFYEKRQEIDSKKDPQHLYKVMSSGEPDEPGISIDYGGNIGIINYGTGDYVDLFDSTKQRQLPAVRNRLRLAGKAPAEKTERKIYVNTSNSNQTYFGRLIRPGGSIPLSLDDLRELDSRLRVTLELKKDPKVERKEFSGQVTGPNGILSEPEKIVVTTIDNPRGAQYPPTQVYYKYVSNRLVRVNPDDLVLVPDTHESFRKTATARVTLDGVEKLRKIRGLENIQVNEELSVFTAEGKSGKGKDPLTEIRYLGKSYRIPQGVLRTGTLEPLGNWFSLENLTVGGRSIPAFTPFNATDQEVGNLKAIRTKAGDLAQDPHMVKYGKTLNHRGRLYEGGESISLSKVEYARGLTADQKAKLVPDDEKADNLRGNQLNKAFQSFQTDVRRITKTAVKELSEDDKQALLAQFGAKSIRGAVQKQLHTAFSRILDRKLREDKAAPAVAPAPAVSPQAAPSEVSAQMLEGKAIYDKMHEARGVLKPWKNLSYERKAAVAENVSPSNPNLNNPELSQEIVQAAIDRMYKDKEKYKEFNVDDKQDYASLLKVYSILDRLDDQNIDYLKETGILKGYFTRVGSYFADWPFIGSEKSGQIKVLLNQLGANLKALQASASDTRPSNWRLELIQKGMPDLTTAESVNAQNIKLAKETVAAALTSFGTMGDTFVIPQEMAAMAKEWGIPFEKIEEDKYYWKDPRVKDEIIKPYTRDRFQKALGDIKPTFEDFLATYPGDIVPILSKDGKRYRRAPDSTTRRVTYKGVKIWVPQVIEIDENGDPITGKVEEIGSKAFK